MISEPSGLFDTSEFLSPAAPISASDTGVDESASLELSPKLRADLLDLDAWGEILATYSRTMRVAVALTDAQGRVLGKIHNAQPVWTLVHDSGPEWCAGCPFCITTGPPCTAVAEALQTGGVAMVRDLAGLTHVAVPLLLGKQYLGAIIAGQVFDRYPDPLPLRRVAKEFGVSAQKLWNVAVKQRPIGSAILKASGDLLCALGHAFLQQRYGAILKARLAETNERFRWLVEGVRDYALFSMDPTGRVTSWNGGAERMLGYVEAEVVGQNFSCIYSPEDIESHLPEKHLQKALQAGRAEDEGWRVRGNREQFWANVNITALLGDAGSVCGFAIIMQDVTERWKIAIAQEEARQERSRLQEEFLSHVSHELRTPLTAIYLFTTNVLDGLLGGLTPEQHKHLTLALDNVKQLKSMVSDLLDITRVDTYKLTVKPQHVSASKLIADGLGTCRTNAEAKRISLRSDVAPGLPFIWADPARVRQILINLIDNGIKFTPELGTVTVTSCPFAEGDGFLCLSVADTGCGISPENLDLVFERLTQVKGGVEASRRGLGLGLFIARNLVSQHGGRIWVESRLGHGSTFFFTLPVFSLAQLCAPIFTEPNLKAGSVTLIAVDVVAVAVDGAVQPDILTDKLPDALPDPRPKIRRLLEHCIHPGQAVLLPSMSDAGPVRTFFIVACTGASGLALTASRIDMELLSFDGAAKLKPVISSNTLLMAPGLSRAEQISEVTARIAGLVQAHVLDKGRLN